jgi:S1-C subfamily serine protease
MKSVAIFALLLVLLPAVGAAAAESLTPDELALVRKAEEQRIKAIASVYGSVVAVYGPARQGGGSGVVFDPAGYALTNHHVVAAAGMNGQAGLADGKLYPWKLIGTDPGGDVAIIKLEGKDKFPVSPLGNSDEVRVGDWAMAMGNPFVLAEDQTPTVTLGVVSGVQRYQYGAGKNPLVYGNCIQVDSSINPGNSGGPLYNMHGQVIGINGRGSFKERGRVNVGVGYAISMKQIRNFIPELMATKMVQHGTLDALFSNRNNTKGQRVVMCDTLNLDSPVARLGLQLGDELISFEGETITEANQYTNLISTLPAGWPCELTFRHEGKEKTVHVRLAALPYGKEQIHPEPEPMPMPPGGEEKPKEPMGGAKEDKPAEKDAPKAEPQSKDAAFQEAPAEEPKAEDKPKDEKPTEKLEEKPPEPRPMPMPIRIGGAKPNFGKEGEIRDLEANRASTKYIFARWREIAGTAALGEKVKGLAIADELLRKDKAIGEVQTVVAADGRFRVAYTEYGVNYAYGFDGKKYWAKQADRDLVDITLDELLEQSIASQAVALAAMLQAEPLQGLGDVQLDGADKAQRRPAFRVRLSHEDKPRWYVWLRQFDDAGQSSVQLAKTGTDIDGVDPFVVYEDWREVSGLKLPHVKRLASGLDEASAIFMKTTEVKVLDQVSDEALQPPAAVENEAAEEAADKKDAVENKADENDAQE